MSTHNIGFNEEMAKIIFQISSLNTHNLDRMPRLSILPIRYPESSVRSLKVQDESINAVTLQ